MAEHTFADQKVQQQAAARRQQQAFFGNSKEASSGTSFIQPKLSINQPNDSYEQEADRVADTVVQRRAAQQFFSTASYATPANALFFKPANTVQRRCAACEEEQVQQKEDETITPLQRSSFGGGAAAADGIEDNLNNTRGGGSPLAQPLRQQMEGAIGADFSQVKIHTGDTAVQLSRDLNAKAFTTGSDIYFNSGQYNPATNEGQHLLAHELTHVVQQQSAPPLTIQRTPGDDVHDPLVQQYCTERGITYAPGLQHTPGYAAWLAQRHERADIEALLARPAPRPRGHVAIDPMCIDTAGVEDLVSETIIVLNRVYDLLMRFETNAVISTAVADPEMQHVAAALNFTFHTNDLDYVSVIRRRFLHMKSVLETERGITVHCSSRSLAGGNAMLGGFVNQPYHVNMTSLGAPGARPVSTFIHELTHAAIPEVGIGNIVRLDDTPFMMPMGTEDRAYHHERMFHLLSTEEALRNADSYAMLVTYLTLGGSVPTGSQYIDQVNGCTQPVAPVHLAIARAQVWTRLTADMLGSFTRAMQGDSMTAVPATGEQYAILRQHLGTGFTLANLVLLKNFLTDLHVNDYGNVRGFDCTTNPRHSAGGTLLLSAEGTVTADAVNATAAFDTLMNINICNSWFGVTADVQARTVFVMKMLGHGNGANAGIAVSSFYRIADLAQAIVRLRTPAVTTTRAREHMDADAAGPRYTGPASLVLVNEFDDIAIDPAAAERERLASLNRVLGSETGVEGTGLLSRLRGLSVGHAIMLIEDERFWERILPVFRGAALWSIYAVLLQIEATEDSGLRNSDTLRRFSFALFEQNAADAIRLLRALMPNFRREGGFRYDILSYVLSNIFENDPLHPDMQRMVLMRPDRHESYRVSHISYEYHEVHYEENETTHRYELRHMHGTGAYTLYRDGGELRIVVKIKTVDGDHPDQGYYLNRTTEHRWVDGIEQNWNNLFTITNGTDSLRLVFVPVFSQDSGEHQRVSIGHSLTNGVTCRRDTRASQYCWPLGISGRVAAHEFGHMLGNRDEYRLPAHVSDIPPHLRSLLRPEDLLHTTAEGVPGTVANSVAGFTAPGLMGAEDSPAMPRHVSNIVTDFNANMLNPGEAAYHL